MELQVGRTQLSGFGLITELINDLRRRPDECQTRHLHLAREFRVLREETVSTLKKTAQQKKKRDQLREAALWGRNPGMSYPGWIMSTPCSSAMRMMSS